VVYVLRLGHRPERDKRVTTHVALTARALGARGIAIWRPDAAIKESVGKATASFGGGFEVRLLDSWRDFLEGWHAPRVLLTMYGTALDVGVAAVKAREREREQASRWMTDPLVVVGAEKLPAVVFESCEFHIAAGNQPHSEVAALALFLDRYFEGRAHLKEFEGAKLRITPSNDLKIVRGRRGPP
jgi:tRNA (cytidine56-2'-O)-methyltransferase